jgi:hypothetical protein
MMEKIDITLKRDGASPITLTFHEGEPEAARERLEFLNFVLRPFAGAEKKPAEKQPLKPAARPAPPAGEAK